MTTQEFENQLKEIDSGLNIRVNPNAKDIAGIYWNNIYVGISCPPIDVYEEEISSYKDAMGFPYHSSKYILEMLPIKLARVKKAFEEDPTIFK